MYKVFQVLCLFVLTNFSFAQNKIKVDLDSYRFSVKHIKFPNIIYPLDMRTYSIEVTSTPSVYYNYPDAEAVLPQKINIDGWKKTNNNPTLMIRFELQKFQQVKTDILQRLVEEKDKDGKVIKSYYKYWLETIYDGIGYVYTNALSVPGNAVKEAPKPAATESNNRFLSGASTTKTTTTDNVSKEIKTTYALGASNIVYKSEEMMSNEAVQKFYRLNKDQIFNNQLNNFINSSVANAKSYLVTNYGFPKYDYSDKLWIIDSTDEEGKIQKEAIEAVKTIFANENVEADIEITRKQLQPLIEYFESLKTKYPDDNKPCRKIRYSAFYNLGKIYYHTDQPEKAIKEGEGLIANDYDKGDGKDIVKDANSLKELMTQKNITSRHQPYLN